jgi:hypothetical protein
MRIMSLGHAVRAAARGWDAGRYQRHRPEQTLLYRIIEQHYPAFVDHMAGQGWPVRLMFPSFNPSCCHPQGTAGGRWPDGRDGPESGAGEGEFFVDEVRIGQDFVMVAGRMTLRHL